MNDETKRSEHKNSGRKQDGRKLTARERATRAAKKHGLPLAPPNQTDLGVIIRMPMEMPVPPQPQALTQHDNEAQLSPKPETPEPTAIRIQPGKGGLTINILPHDGAVE